MRPRRSFLFYVLLLHAALALVLWKSDFLQRVGLHLGISQTWPHYHTMMMYYGWMDASIPDQAVLFLGDSITQGLAVTAVSPNSVNLGIGGDNVAGVADRVPRHTALARASTVVLAVGINDLPWRDDATILADYARALDAMPKGPRVIVSAVLPVASPTPAIKLPEAEARIAAFNQKLQDLAKSRGALFIDAGPKLTGTPGRLRDDYHLGDGLHLSPAGYQIWIKALRDAVAADSTDKISQKVTE
jgi:lysophospholipase L1-like esterase